MHKSAIIFIAPIVVALVQPLYYVKKKTIHNEITYWENVAKKTEMSK